jgi:hypothetical protein
MKQRIKKTCDGCRASEQGKCHLGFKIKTEYRRSNIIANITYAIYSPAEPCPKPKTYNQYIYLLNNT